MRRFSVTLLVHSMRHALKHDTGIGYFYFRPSYMYKRHIQAYTPAKIEFFELEFAYILCEFAVFVAKNRKIGCFWAN